MRTQTSWVCGLVLGIVLSTSTTVRAETRTSSSLSAVPGELRFFPSPISGEPPRTIIGDVGLAAGNVAGAGEKLLYSNTLGTFAALFPANSLIADDISITAANGCPLSRFSFQVTGKANTNACGGPEGDCGPFTVTFALYDNCPGAGGLPIPGTQDEITFEDDDFHTIEVVIPSGTDIPLPPTVWLGIRMDRDDAGVLLGAPALWGFSSDIFDWPGFACIANGGGFPRNPHASFNAEIYGRDTCEDTFVTYRNISPGRGGINATPGAWWADDIELNTDNCLMTAYEFGVKGVGLYRFRLHRSAGGCPGAEIDRTRQAFLAQDDNAKLARITFDPPIQLTSRNLWAAIKSNNSGAAWILTGQDASVGSTDGTFAIDIDGSCSTTFPPGVVHGGFHVVITCAGNAPTGACCDMFVRNNGVCASGACVGGDFDGSICTTSQQCRGDATCRTLPQANCSFPTKGSAARPAWKVGSSCNVCVGGANDGAACEDDSPCAPKACDGGNDEGRPCDNDEECGDASCTSGICEGHNPFEPLPSCGVSACCAPDAGCDNLTERECAFLPPLDKPRVWEVGQFCSQQGQRCPLPACLARAGDCTAPRLKFCRGGTSDGEECFLDSNCPGGSDGICTDLFVPICLGGDHAGEECGDDLDCILGGTCAASLCVGGDFAGTKCEEPRDCRGSICEGQPGCRDPFCCTDVCNFAPGFPINSDFCCRFHWDAECAALAQDPDICEGLLVGNDDCAPGGRTPGAMEIPMNDRRTVSGDQATDSGREPGFCCHGGRFKCDGGCNDREFCFDDGDCQGTDDGYCTYGGDPVTGTCVGGCNAQDRCEEDVICQGGDRAGQPCNFKCTPGTCLSGSQNGNPCDGPSDCPGGFCGSSPCTSDTDCGGEQVCADSIDCPGGVCVGDFCDGSEPGTCSIFEPTPGAQGLGSVWYWFKVPEDGDPGGTMSVQIDTCNSNAPAKDSMLEVFAVRDNDAGRCDGLGQCAGSRDPCNVTTQDCEDFSECVETEAGVFSVTCSVGAQDCPAETTCVLDRTAACGELSLIGCNDDAADGCGNTTQAQNSKLCFPDLIRGETYYIMVAAKTPDTIGSYQVNVRQVSNCSGLLDLVENDYCPNAIPIFDGITPFDLTDTTFDCPADSCLLNLQNDEWFEYIAPFTGRATIEACGGSIETTPDTELIVYDSCDCPSANGRSLSTLCCNGLAGGECFLGARCEIDIVAGKCYKIRIGDNRGGGAIGELLIFAEPADCDGNGIGDNCDIDCGPSGGECDVEGCGTAVDCNENGIPDQCDTRDQTSADCNGNDIPDECEPDCNENNVPDDCDIRDGDADDCQLNGVPDFCEIRDGDCPDVDPADGVCDDCASAVLIDSTPAASAPGDAPAGSLWRSANNIVRLTFDTDISTPNMGDVEIVKMIDDGGCVAGYEADLSLDFTFEVELDGGNNPRILKIQEVGTILEHREWYAIRNTGLWSGVAPFEAQYVVQVGDANGDGRVLFNDLGAINTGVGCFSGCGDDNRFDINGDARILFNDLGAANVFVGSFPVAKPCGH